MVPFAWDLPAGVTQSLTSLSSASSSSRLSRASLPRAPSSACAWRDVLPAPLVPSACSPFVRVATHLQALTWFGPSSCSPSTAPLTCLQVVSAPSLTLPDPPPPSCFPQVPLFLSHPGTACADLGCWKQLVSSCCGGAQAACVQGACAGHAQRQPPTPLGVTQSGQNPPGRN